VTAVAVWCERPDADVLLAQRLEAGWKPTPSYLTDGPRVLGHAAAVPPDRWTVPRT